MRDELLTISNLSDKVKLIISYIIKNRSRCIIYSLRGLVCLRVFKSYNQSEYCLNFRY